MADFQQSCCDVRKFEVDQMCYIPKEKTWWRADIERSRDEEEERKMMKQ